MKKIRTHIGVTGVMILLVLFCLGSILFAIHAKYDNLENLTLDFVLIIICQIFSFICVCWLIRHRDVFETETNNGK